MFSLIKILVVLFGMAFLTLLERKVLGYLQLRKGPNKVRAQGILQPMRDALKLMSKSKQSPYLSSPGVFYTRPLILLVLSYVSWVVVGGERVEFLAPRRSILVVVVMSVRVYSLLARGWVSNSKYAFLGAYRGLAQTISYEVSFIFLLLCPLVSVSLVGGCRLAENRAGGVSLSVIMGVVFFMWVVRCLAEANRAPFDFAEGERELVSGFNIEYRRFEFAMLFMAEYTFILFLCYFSALLFCHGGFFTMGLVVRVVIIVFLLARGSYPRFRYDQLITLAWHRFLSRSIVALLVIPLVVF